MNTATNTALRMPFGIIPDRHRDRDMVFYGRVSTEHEAQLSALENQIQWYDDVAARNPNWTVLEKYLDKDCRPNQQKNHNRSLNSKYDCLREHPNRPYHNIFETAP